MLPKWEHMDRVDALAERMRNGLLVTAAEYFQFKSGQLQPHVVIGPNHWTYWAAQFEQAFWERGDCRFQRASSGGYGYYASDYTALNVRFEPARVHRYLQTLAPGSPADSGAPNSPDNRKPLPEAEQRRFCEVFVAVHGAEAATESFARRAIGAMYPDNSVSRDGFRELLRSIRELKGEIRKGRPRVAEK